MSLGMPLARYQRVLAVRAARDVLLLGMLVRIPMFAGMVLLTVHVVQTLGRSYTEAGLVTTVATVCVAVSGPWRGRLLDRLGLRRVVLPSVLVVAACWSVAPFAGYAVLVVLAGVSGLFVVPTFSIVRAAVITAVGDELRRTALSLDSVLVEVAFIAGPVLGIWAATKWSTSWVLFGIEMSAALAGLGLWLLNPPIRADAADADGDRQPGTAGRSWFAPAVLAVLVAAGAGTLVLSGSDIAIVAAMRDYGSYDHIGLVLAVWGLGSVVGGLVYGSLHRPVSAFLLLAGLAVTTVPLALAAGPWALGALAFVTGLLCAPTITATVDQLSALVPGTARSEAMGWHGSFMTTGSALGAPAAGAAIDRWGFGGGFVLAGVLGLALAVGCWSLARRGPVPAHPPVLVPVPVPVGQRVAEDVRP